MEVSVSKEERTASGARREPKATGGAPEEQRDGRGRWSAKRKAAAILRLLRGEDLETLSRKLGVTRRTCPAADSFCMAAKHLRALEADVENEETQRLKSLVADLREATSCCVKKSRMEAAPLWPGGGRSHEPRRFAPSREDSTAWWRVSGNGRWRIQLFYYQLRSPRNPASAAAARTEDGV